MARRKNPPGRRSRPAGRGRAEPAGRGRAKPAGRGRTKPAGAGRARPATRGRANAPRLLSGGNPQVAKADGDDAVQVYIDAMPDWKRDIGRRVDAVVTRAVPGVHKAVKWNSPFYGVHGKGWFLSFHCFTNYVKLSFFYGAMLDPLPPGTSTQKNVRYLDIRRGDPVDERQLAHWAKQASQLPGWGNA